ncbi:MAG: tRNA dihydrouridine(20/20a) synthase DusA [Gammaproteobacteria bacterium]|nr:tRNA dihydrouridine(20/20a) synthase DusA [Gammaproteobacteria bacterium]
MFKTSSESPEGQRVTKVAAGENRAVVNRRFCIAPMMDCSDRHSRFFLRLFSDRVLLYTEMITAAAVLHGDRDHLLGFNKEEHPLAVQLGGSDPEQLFRAARICAEYGYDEINLNCGCPSDRVQSGSFGACLMNDPALVADCMAALRSATSLPVTVKHRTGIDQQDDYDIFAGFAGAQIDAGAQALIVHARNAWLQGLSPKQNREIPPLKYDWVYRLKRDFPDHEIVINGGIKTLEACRQHLLHVDGVMLGREPYQNPYLLHNVDQVIFDQPMAEVPSRIAMLHRLYPYIEQQLGQGMPLTHMVRHIIGLFHGEPNARRWRRYLSENAHRKKADIEILYEAERLVS